MTRTIDGCPLLENMQTSSETENSPATQSERQAVPPPESGCENFGKCHKPCQQKMCKRASTIVDLEAAKQPESIEIRFTSSKDLKVNAQEKVGRGATKNGPGKLPKYTLGDVVFNRATQTQQQESQIIYIIDQTAPPLPRDDRTGYRVLKNLVKQTLFVYLFFATLLIFFFTIRVFYNYFTT